MRNVWLYQVGENLRMVNRVTMAAARGMPKNAATLVATVEYEDEIGVSESLMTLMKRIASGA